MIKPTETALPDKLRDSVLRCSFFAGCREPGLNDPEKMTVVVDY